MWWVVAMKSFSHFLLERLFLSGGLNTTKKEYYNTIKKYGEKTPPKKNSTSSKSGGY
jgi:hypothetical protein